MAEILSKISPKHKGVLCIISSAFCFAFMGAFVRLAGDLPSVQKYMLIENCPMYRSTGLRPAAPVRYQTSGERQRNQSRYSSWKQRGIWCPPTA